MASARLKPIRLALLQSIARTLRKWADRIAPKSEVADDHRGGGPPQDWVERVRLGAPELLLRPEEGGVAPQFAQEAEGEVKGFFPKRPASEPSQALHEAPPRLSHQQEATQRSAVPVPGRPEHKLKPSRHERGRLPSPEETRSDELPEYRTSFGQSRGPMQQERARAELQAKASNARKGQEGPRETSERKQARSASSSRIVRALERVGRAGRQRLGRRETSEVSATAKNPVPLEMTRPASSTSPERELRAIPKVTLATNMTPHHNVTLGPSLQRDVEERGGTEQTAEPGLEEIKRGRTPPRGMSIQLPPDHGSEGLPGVSKGTKGTRNTAPEAVVSAFTRVPPSEHAQQFSLKAAAHPELRLDDAVSRHEWRRLQNPTERAPGSTPYGARPFEQASVPLADHFDPLQNHWPDLPEEPASLMNELLEAVRTLERAKRLELEQRGEGPWSA